MLERTELLLSHYDREICPHQIALPADDAGNPYRLYILPLAYEQIGPLYAVLGLTACHIGIKKDDAYPRDTLAVEYQARAIRCLSETLQNDISGELGENERDGIFATIQVLLLQDASQLFEIFTLKTRWLTRTKIFETGISTHGIHITGALSIRNQLRLSDILTEGHERNILPWKSGMASPQVQPLYSIQKLNVRYRLDIIRSLADPQKLCFSPALREIIVNLSDLKFEQVNGCPRELFLTIGTVLGHAKAHEIGHMDGHPPIRASSHCRPVWPLHVASFTGRISKLPFTLAGSRRSIPTRLNTAHIPLVRCVRAEATIIQISVTAILDAIAEIPRSVILWSC
ncbi:unnamed protein product [Penicillium egyptiacum]|uniref:Uncharacterized protein n=1 Tax=Penicillium egyptiacum TaxID=1303716 RepID=A0A9W4PAG5_9EURO|nr:unnamed protein product [Penicillium egyptiacum]